MEPGRSKSYNKLAIDTHSLLHETERRKKKKLEQLPIATVCAQYEKKNLHEVRSTTPTETPSQRR
jgi:hypothetical protein